MIKGGILRNIKKYMKYKSPILIVCLLLVITIACTINKNQVENYTNNKKIVLEATLWVDASNAAQPNNDFITFDWPKIKMAFERNEKVIIRQQEFKDLANFYSSLSAENDIRSVEKKEQEGGEAANQFRTLLPYITVTLLNKTNGKTVEEGAKRSFSGFIGLYKTNTTGDQLLTREKVENDILTSLNLNGLNYT